MLEIDGTPLQPQELLRRKRLGGELADVEIAALVAGIADGRLGDAQVGAFAMAVCARGMDVRETTALTRAMRDSGRVLDWRAAGFDAPVLDKHSTGGIGDVVSLMLGPMLAACGALVPMLSGRGLGHTGGTLDKLESIPGYRGVVDVPTTHRCLRAAGVAIIGAGPELAPADRRLYAVRDITGTVESLPLITASILSKKLAANTDALVLDVKTGSGAFMQRREDARELARSLVTVANRAGLRTRALITDMDQSLAPAVGNALETRLAIDYLVGRRRPARLHALTVRLGAEAMQLAGMVTEVAEGERRMLQTLASGAAAERFARMVVALGGPTDILENAAHFAAAPVIAPVHADRAGIVARIDARALGVAVVGLGGGRSLPTDVIDPRVGLTEVLELGVATDADTPLAIVHAADESAWARAATAVRAAYTLDERGEPPELVQEVVG
ncbi:MAG: thymidine phosphorylase [Xanthomonadales bacterium PRO6]|nr:Thymidine phosphorylase [Xanthomonadales bacterium]MCE7931399.1 thymidine phosphorylase [Xanthomonadales bacterium PRO6]